MPDLSQDGGGAGLNETVSLAHKTLAGGKYQVNEELGRGGMSVVYSATDLTLGRLVAVKVLLTEYAQTVGPEAAMRFQQEARSVAKLSHPHIISIYEYGLLEDGAPFIVMDYIVGASLSDEMEAHGLMSEDRVLEIVKQSAEALRHSHAQGVVHRDIKPSNLLLTKGDDGEDYVRVVDFGIAKMQTQDSTGKLTRTGQVFGSPLYMSPEQCEGLVADARSDI
jgi:serine/threonine protein kinase